MLLFKKYIVFIALFSLLISCGRAPEGDYSYEAKQSDAFEQEKPHAPQNGNISSNLSKTTDPQDLIASNALKYTGDSSKIFIKSAQLKFSVKNLSKTTIKIEDICFKNGGYVAHSKLNNQIVKKENKALSPDSTLESIHAKMTNTIILKVPQEQLDTTLRSIVKYAQFLDYRTINVEDISLEILKKQMAQKRATALSNNLSKTKNKKPELNDAITLEEKKAQALEQKDQNYIEELRIMDQVKWSTIQLSIYEKERIYRSIHQNPKNISAYEPSFAYKAKVALSKGWDALQSFTLALLKLWPLWILFALAYLLYIKFSRKE